MNSIDSNVHLNQGLCWHGLKEYEKATECYSRANKFSENGNEIALFYRGVCQKSLGKLKEAKKSFDKAIEKKPDYSNALFYKGLMLHQMKEYKKAVTYYDKTLELNEKNAAAQNNRGVISQTWGEFSVLWICYSTESLLHKCFV